MSQPWASYAILVQAGCSFGVYSTTVPKSSNKIENVQNINTDSSNWMYLSSLVVCVCLYVCVKAPVHICACVRVHTTIHMSSAIFKHLDKEAEKLN